VADPVLVFDRETVFLAVDASRAIDSVTEGFIRYAKGEWSMPAKVYLQSPPFGDFRAMPASGDGLATLKWVTSFPGNRERGLPVVLGTILVSDATTGRWLALVEGGAVTALRTGAAAAVATRALGPPTARAAGIVGCGLHGRWAGLCLKASGFEQGVCADRDPQRSARLAEELGWSPGSASEALGCDVVTMVTPGYEPIVQAYRLKERMPQAQLSLLNECSHFLWLEQPARLGSVLSTFLAS
jgi:alanine dehydrogenase